MLFLEATCILLGREIPGVGCAIAGSYSGDLLLSIAVVDNVAVEVLEVHLRLVGRNSDSRQT
jgi:hypothetical protein